MNPDAYALEDNPNLKAVVKVKLKNGKEISTVKYKLLDEDVNPQGKVVGHKMKNNFQKVKDGRYEEI